MNNKKSQVQVKAKVSFCGEVSAGAGAVFFCPGDIAKKLIARGYVELFKKDSLITEGERDVKGKQLNQDRGYGQRDHGIPE